MIPRRRPASLAPAPAPASETPTDADKVQIEVLEVYFTNGHAITLPIYPGDTFLRDDAGEMFHESARSGERTYIPAEHVLYTCRKRALAVAARALMAGPKGPQ